MNYTKEFLKQFGTTFIEAKSTLGSGFEAMLFFLQGFESWLEKTGALTENKETAQLSTNSHKPVREASPKPCPHCGSEQVVNKIITCTNMDCPRSHV